MTGSLFVPCPTEHLALEIIEEQKEGMARERLDECTEQRLQAKLGLHEAKLLHGRQLANE